MANISTPAMMVAFSVAGAALSGCGTAERTDVLPPRPANAARVAGGQVGGTVSTGGYQSANGGAGIVRGSVSNVGGSAPRAARSRRQDGIDRPSGTGACNNAAAQSLIGQLGTTRAKATAKAESGAETVRITYPNQPLTQEYNPARLNLETNAQNRIVAVRCG